jgi:hypothetical protein
MPSEKFIQQLEDSPKWSKDSICHYHCSYPISSGDGIVIIVNPHSQIIIAKYGQWIIF